MSTVDGKENQAGTYGRRLLLVHSRLVLLNSLFATEEDETVAHVTVLVGRLPSQTVSLNVVVAGGVSGGTELRVGAFRLVGDEAEGVDRNLFALDEGGRALDRQLEDGSVCHSPLELCAIRLKLVILVVH